MKLIKACLLAFTVFAILDVTEAQEESNPTYRCEPGARYSRNDCYQMAFVYNEFEKAAVPWLEENLKVAWDWFNVNVWKYVTDFMKTDSANLILPISLATFACINIIVVYFTSSGLNSLAIAFALVKTIITDQDFGTFTLYDILDWGIENFAVTRS